jgi:hypothetical protein
VIYVPLQSTILSGNARLDSAFSGGPSVKTAPPPDDVDAVRRIQKGLKALGYSLPISFAKGTGGEPDGKFGQETYQAVIAFQRSAFPGQSSEWDGRVGHKTLEKMDALLPRGGAPPAPTPPTPPAVTDRVCGPDVTEQVAKVWNQMQSDFNSLVRAKKIAACNAVLIPVTNPGDLVKSLAVDAMTGRLDLNRLISQIGAHGNANAFDTRPLQKDQSQWLDTPPVYDPATNGPCCTPQPKPGEDPEGDAFCSKTVQVADKCWLAGSVNYGTYGIIVRCCSDFAADDWFVPNPLTTDPFDLPLRPNPVIRAIYSLTWATTLIRIYKSKLGDKLKGQGVEDPAVPIAWTEATFRGGPKGTPSIAGNRSTCKCSCPCKGDVATVKDKWDYIWDPLKSYPP